MKNKFIKSLILITLVTISSIYLSGCMMAGMGMMHGDGNHRMDMENHSRSRIIVKEYNTAEYKITAEFPSNIVSNTDICRIKIFDITANVNQKDVDVFLEVVNENTDGHNDHSQNTTSHRLNDVRIEDGYFVFTPNISSESSYRLKFYIKKIGMDIFNPPIEIEFTTDQQSEMINSHPHYESGSILTSPYFYIGAVAMAVMMLFMFR